jgi:hypothetical protein
LLQKKNSTQSAPEQLFYPFRYDKIEIAIKWDLNSEMRWEEKQRELFELLEVPVDGNKFKILSGSMKKKYRSYRKLESKTERIEMFYGRYPKEETENAPVWAYFRITCKDKVNGYENHIKTILHVEKALEKLGLPFYQRKAELCLDFPDRETFDWIFQRVTFAWSSPLDYRYWPKGQKNGKPFKGFDPDRESMIVKFLDSPRELSMYIKTEDGITRHRMELKVKRGYLKRQEVNTFTELMKKGPDFLLKHIILAEFDLQKILKLRGIYKSAGTCSRFYKKGKSFFENLMNSPSAEILSVLSKLLKGHMSQYEIRTKFGRKISFPGVLLPRAINKVVQNKQKRRDIQSQSLLRTPQFARSREKGRVKGEGMIFPIEEKCLSTIPVKEYLKKKDANECGHENDTPLIRSSPNSYCGQSRRRQTGKASTRLPMKMGCERTPPWDAKLTEIRGEQ